MKHIILSLILLVLISSNSLYGQDENTSFDYYMEGVKQYCLTIDNPDRDNIEKTISLLNKAIEADPKNDAAYYYLGLVYTKSQDISQAIKYLKKAETLNPGNYWYKVLTARLYYGIGEYDMAVKLFEDLIENFPDKTISYFELLDIYIKNNDIEKASKYIDKIETIYGPNEATTTTKYQILLTQGKVDEALEILTEFNKENATPYTLFSAGNIYAQKFKDTLALECFDKAIAMAKNYSLAYLGKAEVYRMRMDMDNYFKNINKFISAPEIAPGDKISYLDQSVMNPGLIYSFRKEFDTVINCLTQAHPYDTLATHYAGLYHIALGDTAKGIKLYEECIEHNPESVAAYMNYLLALYNIQKWDDIIAVGEKGLEIAPKDLGINELVAISYWQDGNIEKSIKQYKKLVSYISDENYPMIINCYAALGDLYNELGNSRESFKYYDKGLALDPDFCPILNNYAYHLSIKNKKLDKALKMSRKTIEVEPENSIYLDTFGWILYLKGDYKAAKKYLKKAIIYGGKESAAIMDHYADALFATGDYDLAFLYWNDAHKLDPSLGIDKKIRDKRKEVENNKK